MKDEDLMPFGKYAGKKMENVPAKYLHYLYHDGLNHIGVKKYIEENMDALKMETPNLIWEKQT